MAGTQINSEVGPVHVAKWQALLERIEGPRNRVSADLMRALIDRACEAIEVAAMTKTSVDAGAPRATVATLKDSLVPMGPIFDSVSSEALRATAASAEGLLTRNYLPGDEPLGFDDPLGTVRPDLWVDDFADQGLNLWRDGFRATLAAFAKHEALAGMAVGYHMVWEDSPLGRAYWKDPVNRAPAEKSHGGSDLSRARYLRGVHAAVVAIDAMHTAALQTMNTMLPNDLPK